MKAECPVLDRPPERFVDPARLEWEHYVVSEYGRCRERNAAKAEAIDDLLRRGQKPPKK